MNDPAPTPPLEVSHPIAYQAFGRIANNPDFEGQGLLIVRPARPSFAFQGLTRSLFGGRPTELEFGPDDIWNVVLNDCCISFHTTLGTAGKTKQPFIFFCRDATEARNLAALLPTRQEQGVTDTQEFTTRLDALADAQGPWSSVTNVIIALNVLGFVIMGGLGAGWFAVNSMTPYLLGGANNGAATTDGEWWRLLTSMFVHYGLIHLVLNMWALYQAGHFLEKLLGRWLYALCYLGSGLAGGLLSIAWHGDKAWSAGASGAVFGVYGAILGYLLREKQSLPPGVYKSMLLSTLTFAGYNVFHGLRAGVDNSAHIGGLLGGLVLGWLVALPADREVRAGRTRNKLLLGVVVLAVIMAAGVFLTPRYDYSVRDELAWETVNTEFVARETELNQRHQQAMAELKKGGNGAPHAQWLATVLLPFYEQWDHRITALPLDAGRRTARNREALDRILKLRIQSYQHLVAGLRDNNPAAVEKYLQENTQVSREIEQWKKVNGPSA